MRRYGPLMSKRRTAILRVAFWSSAVFALVMALHPHPPQVPGAPSDKVQHIAAFLTLGALGSFAYPRTNPLYLGAGLSLFGAAIEILQLIGSSGLMAPPNRASPPTSPATLRRQPVRSGPTAG